jgi:hypothetical protein
MDCKKLEGSRSHWYIPLDLQMWRIEIMATYDDIIIMTNNPDPFGGVL